MFNDPWFGILSECWRKREWSAFWITMLGVVLDCIWRLYYLLCGIFLLHSLGLLEFLR